MGTKSFQPNRKLRHPMDLTSRSVASRQMGRPTQVGPAGHGHPRKGIWSSLSTVGLRSPKLHSKSGENEAKQSLHLGEGLVLLLCMGKVPKVQAGCSILRYEGYPASQVDSLGGPRQRAC